MSTCCRQPLHTTQQHPDPFAFTNAPPTTPPSPPSSHTNLLAVVCGQLSMGSVNNPPVHPKHPLWLQQQQQTHHTRLRTTPTLPKNETTGRRTTTPAGNNDDDRGMLSVAVCCALLLLLQQQLVMVLVLVSNSTNSSTRTTSPTRYLCVGVWVCVKQGGVDTVHVCQYKAATVQCCGRQPAGKYVCVLVHAQPPTIDLQPILPTLVL